MGLTKYKRNAPEFFDSVIAEQMIILSAATSYTEPVEMGGANTVSIDLEILYLPAGASIRAQAEVSNDLENWKLLSGSPAGRDSVGISRTQYSAVAGRFARVRVFFNSGTGAACVSASLYLASL